MRCIDGEVKSFLLEDIIELILADEDGVVFLNALLDEGIQDAALTQLALEVLQALVVVHIAARQDDTPARGRRCSRRGPPSAGW